MSSSCNDLKTLLKDCLMRSDCVVKDGHLPSDCLRNHTEELPEECQAVRVALYNCKRGMLDMRKRFRGNNPGYIPPQNSPPTPTPVVPASAS